MQALRGALQQGRPMAPQNVSCPVISTEASSAAHQTPKPRSAHRQLLDWARSAVGLPRQRDRPATAAAAEGAAAAAAASSPATAADAPGRLRLAIVGDVHGLWRDEREEAALRLLAPDLTLLVGDFGNEDVGLVQRVAALPLPKAVILGNHDAWYSMTGRAPGPAGRGGAQQTQSAADLLAALERGGGGGGGGAAAGGAAAAAVDERDAVRQQLAALGACHVGYGTKRLDAQGYTVMGARPFSKGGKNFSTMRPFMEGLYGVTSMDESAQRIVQVAESAPAHHALIVMGHNGPTGLGSRAFDICGVDWQDSKAGDHGDPDLQAALAAIHKAGRRVALVTFGHMHHTLNYSNNRGRASRFRRMVALDPATGTVFLNAATVPRVTSAPTTAAKAPPPSPALQGASLSSPKSYGSGRRARMAAKAAAAAATAAATGAAAAAAAAAREGDPATVHHFMLAELEQGEVVSARDVWVQVTPVTDSSAAAVLEAAAAAVAAASAAAAAPSGSRDGDEGSSGSEDEMPGTGPTSPAASARRIGDFVVQVIREHVVLRTVVGADGGVVKFVWNAYDQIYEPVVLAGGSDGGRADPGLGGIGGGAQVNGGATGHVPSGEATAAPAEARDGAARNCVDAQSVEPLAAASVSG